MPHLRIVDDSNKLTEEEIERFFPVFKQEMAIIKEQNTLSSLVVASQSIIKTTDVDEKDIGDKTDCIICLCPIEESEDTRAGFCKHIFHSHCLITWFKKQRVSF